MRLQISTVSLVANVKLDASPFYDDTTSNSLIVAGDNRFNTKDQFKWLYI